MDGAVLLVQPVVGSSHPDIDRSHQPHLVSVILDVSWDTNLTQTEGIKTNSSWGRTLGRSELWFLGCYLREEYSSSHRSHVHPIQAPIIPLMRPHSLPCNDIMTLSVVTNVRGGLFESMKQSM